MILIHISCPRSHCGRRRFTREPSNVRISTRGATWIEMMLIHRKNPPTKKKTFCSKERRRRYLSPEAERWAISADGGGSVGSTNRGMCSKLLVSSFKQHYSSSFMIIIFFCNYHEICKHLLHNFHSGVLYQNRRKRCKQTNATMFFLLLFFLFFTFLFFFNPHRHSQKSTNSAHTPSINPSRQRGTTPLLRTRSYQIGSLMCAVGKHVRQHHWLEPTINTGSQNI